MNESIALYYTGLAISCYVAYNISKYLPALLAKWAKQIERIEKREPGPRGEQYALLAPDDGYYRNYNTGGMTYLNRGDVWKYGQTFDPENRYRNSQYESIFYYSVEFRGCQRDCLVMEIYKIAKYRLSHNLERPPGNPIDK